MSAARSAAFDILLRVERENAFASELLHSARIDKLSLEDCALCMELVMGVLRWRSVLDAAIASASSQPLPKLDSEVLLSLRLAAYQMRFLQRIPARAAIHESVELVKRARKRSATGFVNAVLRKLSQTPPGVASPESAKTAPEIARHFSHPEWLVDRWIRFYGHERTLQICRHDQQVPPTTVHLPFDAALRAQVEAELTIAGIELSPGGIVSVARLVASGDVRQTRPFLERKIWIQDEASQLVALLVGHGERLLDCCAAPGGKAAILAERNPQSRILAMELHPQRARQLRERIASSNVDVVTGDINEQSPVPEFDRVLADVPCSGTGTLARNPEIRWRLQEVNLAACSSAQSDILRSALKHLVPGGRLIYSTCSLEPEENENVIRQVLEEAPGIRLADCGEELERLRRDGELAWPEIETLWQKPFLRTIPGLHPCDGFFAAILERVS